MDERCIPKEDLAQMVRLALGGENEDVRLFVARLVRKYRNADPELADELNLFLRNKSVSSRSPLRKKNTPTIANNTLPIDDESRLSLLKAFHDEPDKITPLMSESLEENLNQLIQERRQRKRLSSLGLQPTSSAIFVGPPGVGKTITARWIASQLKLPLYVLDLTAVMSSFLGRSGSNLRSALDFAKQTPCVLLLDEIDAIAKRRSDDTDIGELKRLVTVILQEVENWDSNGLLLAATNHPELIDPALWRRFDVVVKFNLPGREQVKQAIKRYLGNDCNLFGNWIETLILLFDGKSYSDIERNIQRFRRMLALGVATEDELIEEYIKHSVSELERKERIELAKQLSEKTKCSQHSISNITGVSRDTIRKHSNKKKPKHGG